MRIDEFKRFPTGHIVAADRVRLESVGFDILSILVVICMRYLNSHINPSVWFDGLISNELPMSSHINREVWLDGDLCR